MSGRLKKSEALSSSELPMWARHCGAGLGPGPIKWDSLRVGDVIQGSRREPENGRRSFLVER